MDEQFATNDNVKKFTEKVNSPLPDSNSNFSKGFNSNNILDSEFSIPKSDKPVEFVEYVDLRNNENYKYSKNVSRKLLFQSLATSACLVGMVILCWIVTIFSQRSGLFYLFFISSILISMFYPIIIFTNIEKLRLKYQEKLYTTKTKKKIYVGLTLLLITVLSCIIVNISIGNNTIGSMLSFNNFENIYAPLLFTSVLFLDILFNYIFLAKSKK